MAPITQQVIVQLIVDESQLQPTIDLLEKTGQIDSKLANGFRQTTAEINKQAAAIKNDNSALADMQKNFDKINAELKEQLDFFKGFQEGIEDALKEAGVSLEDFLNALKKGPEDAAPATESLRQRLKAITVQLAELKLAGQDNTEQFEELVKEAGRIKDALGDVSNEIKNVASDTGVFDGLISAAQGVAGAFAVGQGVVALFGDESEELQKTLLKVNAAMAILQGLQQIQNVLQKESAASRLLDVVAAKAQIVVQRIYTAVTGQATAATTAFKVALTSTGVLALVVGIIALVQALNQQDDALEDVNDELARNKALIDADIDAIQRRTEIAVAEAQKAGAVESDITKLRGQSLLAQRAAILDANKDLARQRDSLDNTSDSYFELNKRIEQNAEALKGIDTKLLLENLNFQKQLADEARKSAIGSAEAALLAAKEGSKKQLALQLQLINLKAQADINAAGLTEGEKTAILERALRARQELQVEFNKRELQESLAAVQNRLINVQEGSEEEFRLKVQQLRIQTKLEQQSLKLSEDEKRLIREKGFQEELKLIREFNRLVLEESIRGQVSRNNAELANINTNAEDRLLLTISNIELQAQLEIEAANKNAAKIKEINAKRDADIIKARKDAIEQQAAEEIELRTANEGAANRALERIANEDVKKRGQITLKDIRENIQRRIIAIQQLAQFELSNIETREAALQKEREQNLISEKEYNLRYAQLQDEKAKLSEDTEKKITDLHAAEAEKRKAIDQQFIENLISVTSQVLDVVGQLNDLRAQKDQEQLEGERARVQEQLESGQITEKEAIERNKRIDAEEKKLKREQAQRDKNLAIFNAIINTAAAVTKALPNLVLAGIAAALGAAQIAIIAARPVPKFKGGKKDRYEGPGYIGDAGPEIFEHEGQRYIANKETLVWLGKSDKVYTAQETRKMLMPSINREIMKPIKEQPVIDGDKFAGKVAQAVAGVLKEIPQTNLSVDSEGFQVWTEKGLNRTNYMNKYYSSK